MIYAWILFTTLVLVVLSWIVYKYLAMLYHQHQKRHSLDFRLGYLTVYNFCYSPTNSQWTLNIQQIQLLFSPPQTKHERWITFSIQGISLTIDTTIAVDSSPTLSTTSRLKFVKRYMVLAITWIRTSRYCAIFLRGLKLGLTIPIQWCLALLTGYVKIQLKNVSLNWVTSKGMHYCLHLSALNCQSTLFNVMGDDFTETTQQIYSMKQTQHVFRDKQINISIHFDYPHLSVATASSTISTTNDVGGDWQSVMQLDSFPLTTAFTLTPDCLTLLGANIFCGIDTLKLYMLPLLRHSVDEDQESLQDQQDSKSVSNQPAIRPIVPDEDDNHTKATQTLMKSCQGALEIGRLFLIFNNDEHSSFYSQLALVDLTLTSSTILLSQPQQQKHNLDMTVESIIYSLVDKASSTCLSDNDNGNDHAMNLLSTSVLSVQTNIQYLANGGDHGLGIRADKSLHFMVTLNNPILAIDMVKRHLLESWISQLSSWLPLSRQPNNNKGNQSGSGFLAGHCLPNLDMSLVLISPKVHLQHLLPRDDQHAMGMQGIFHCNSVRYILSGEYDLSSGTPPLLSPASSTTSLHAPSSSSSSRRKRSANLIQRIKAPTSTSAPSSSTSSIKSGMTSGHSLLLSPLTSASNTIYKTVFWLNIDNMRVDYWQHYQWIPWVSSKHLDLAIKTDLALPFRHSNSHSTSKNNSSLLMESIMDMELQATMGGPMVYLCDESLEMDPITYWSALLNPILSLASQKLPATCSDSNRGKITHPLDLSLFIQLYQRCTASFSMLAAKVWIIAMDTKKATWERCSPPEGYLDNTPTHDIVTTAQLSMDKFAMDLENRGPSHDEAVTQDLGNIRLSLHRLVLSQHTTSLTDDGQHWGGSDYGDGCEEEQLDLPMTVLAWISRLQITLNLDYYQDALVPILVGVDIKLRKIGLRYSLGNHYAVLLIIKALHHLAISTQSNQGMGDNGIKNNQSQGLPSLQVRTVKSQIFRFDLHILLPGQNELYLRADDLDTFWRHPSSTQESRPTENNNVVFSVTNITLLGVSPPSILGHGDRDQQTSDGKKKWEALLELDDVEWLADSISCGNGTLMETTTIVMTKAAVRIPYGYILAPVLENTVNLVKGIKELHGRLLAGDNAYYTYIGPIPRNSPIALPTITLQCNQIMIRLDDDPFEAKLRQIVRVGQTEQVRRMNLEAEFEKEKTRYQEQHLQHHQQQQPSFKSFSYASSSYSNGKNSNYNQHFTPTYNPTKSKRYSQSINTTATNDNGATAEEHIDTARRRLWTIHSESWIKHIQVYQQKETETNDQLRQADYRYRCVVECLDPAYDHDDNGPGDKEDDSTDNTPGGELSNIADLFCLDILPLPLHAALAQLTMEKSIMTISQQQGNNKQGGLFPLDETILFVHNMGNGVPIKSDFSFLIPFCLTWQAGETLVQVRDYPLPLLHIPPATKHHGQQLKQQNYPFTNPVAWSLCGNYVIADDLGVKEGSRIITLDTVPSIDHPSRSHYSIKVVRTASPTKFYSLVDYNIYTSSMSTICYSISYQPAIQDIAEILESITPAPVDPSPKIGTWDKLRLMIHTRTKFTFSGGGDVTFVSKGTRDPYQLMGLGAGMAKLWRGHVVWYLGYENTQQEFTQIQSDSYVLGVPDLIRGGYLLAHPGDPPFGDDDKNRFLKIAIKLTGGVQMGIGCHLERTCSPGCQVCKNDGTPTGQTCRLLYFKPHYEVLFKSSDFVGNTYHDAYTGFRSDFVHLSISIIKSPTSNDTSNEPPITKDATVNAMHLSPHFVSHFRQWYGLFGGPLSLPIRHGPLFDILRGLDDPPDPPVKLGRHLQSLKYKIMIQPMAFGYFCMLDERRDNEIGPRGVDIDAIGLKANVSHFCVDVHQRRKLQPTAGSNGDTDSPAFPSSSSGTSIGRGEDELYRVKSNWPLHEVEIQLRTVDLRAIYTRNTPFAPKHLPHDDIDFIDSNNDHVTQRWIDPDDFRELGLEADYSAIAATAIALPFAYSPCVDYVKRLDPIWVERNRHLKNTHACSMGSAKGTLETQSDYLYHRIGIVEEQICIHQQQLENLEMCLSKQAYNADLLQKANETISVISNLNSRRHLLSRYIQKLSQQGPSSNNISTPSKKTDSKTNQANSASSSTKQRDTDFDETSLKQWENMMGRFKERYTVHNPQIIWTPAVHDIVNRWRDAREDYYIQAYNISSRATQLLREIVERCTIHENQQYHGYQQRSSTNGSSSSRNDTQNTTQNGLDSHAAQILLNQLLVDRDHHFVVANETNQQPQHQQQQQQQQQSHYTAPSSAKWYDTDNNSNHDSNDQADDSDNSPRYQLDQIPDGYSSENMTLIDLWNPQVFLQSNGRQDCGILVANERVQVKQFEIIEAGNNDVDTFAVKKRTVANVEAVQLFVTRRGPLGKVDLLLDDHYGINLHQPSSSKNNLDKQEQHNQHILSPWIPPEMFVDDFIGQHHTTRFLRFGNDSNITGTIQYDRYNPIRSSSAYQSSSRHCQPWDDQCNSTHLHFPNFDFTADPYQYSVLYQVVCDIILFKKEPRHLERTDRLRDITFSIYANGDSPQKTLEDVMDLQTKIRHFSQLYHDYQRQLVIQSTHGGNNVDGKSNGLSLLQQRCHSARQHLVTYQEALFLLMQSFKQMMDKYYFQQGYTNLNDSNNNTSSQSSPKPGFDSNDRDFNNQAIAVSKVKISVKVLVWKMLQHDGSPFSQWKLTNTSYVLISNKDQSLCHTIEVDKLLVKNTSSSPVFKQVIGPYLESLSRSPSSPSMVVMPDFFRHKMIYGRLVSLKPVGGIPVIQQLEINLFPLRLQLTYDFWRAFVVYLFPSAPTSPPAKSSTSVTILHSTTTRPTPSRNRSNSAPSINTPMGTGTQHKSSSGAPQETTAIHPLESSSISVSHQHDLHSVNSDIDTGIWFGETRKPSSISSLTSAKRHNSRTTTGGGSKRASWSLMNGSLKPPKLRNYNRSTPTNDNQDNQDDDLMIMKQRASNNRTFILIKIHGAKHCLSFQGTKNIYDLQNFCFRQPNLEYRNKTWSWYDLLNALKKDFLRAVIKHSPALIKEKLKPRRLLSDSSKINKFTMDDEDTIIKLDPSRSTSHQHQAIVTPSTHESFMDSETSKEIIELGIDGWFDEYSSTDDDDDDDGDDRDSVDIEVDDGGNSIRGGDSNHQQFILDTYLDVDDLEINSRNVITSDSLGGQTEEEDDDDLVSIHSITGKDIVIDSPTALSDSEVVLAGRHQNKKDTGNGSDGLFGKTISKLLPFSRKGKHPRKHLTISIDSTRNNNTDENDDGELERMQKGKLLFGKSYR
ncbi:golgi-body localization protein domain-containing protein [Chlamydoabsidia padenii]|nr:golgi-body localization protein domain-containing protein [Chlamydoabsidia padenii]